MYKQVIQWGSIVAIVSMALTGCHSGKSKLVQAGSKRAVDPQNQFIAPRVIGGQYSSEVGAHGQMVHFEFNSDQLTAVSKQKLAVFVQRVKSYKKLRVKVLGHTDERGSSDYNFTLGWRRAKVVAIYMQQMGLDMHAIDALSMGKERPLNQAHNEVAWQLNRRAEWVVYE